MSDFDVTSAVSFPVNIHRIPDKGLEVTIEADQEQCDALADTHGLDAVKSFTAELLLSRWKKDGLRLTGRVTADIVQSCVISLEPVESRLVEEIDSIFAPEGSRLLKPVDPSGEIFVDVEGDDMPEPFSGPILDVGAVSEEYLELAIDPYPRKPDVSLPSTASADEERKPSPFAKLAALKASGD